MTAHGSSSPPDEREIANAAAATAGRRRRQPAARRPGMRAGRRHSAGTDSPAAARGVLRADSRPAAFVTAPPGDVPLRARPAGCQAVERTGHHHIDLGPVRLSLLSRPASPAAAEMARGDADGLPAAWHLVYAIRGPLDLGRGQRLVRLEPGSVTLWEPSGDLRLPAAAGPPVRALVLHVPETALPLPGEVLREVAGRPAPTGSGPAALLASFLYGLAAHPPSAGARHTEWLGTAAVSLVTAFLDSETALLHGDRGATAPRPADPRPTPPATDELLRGIKAYIERHLGDAGLSPGSIAAANHISLRYLHHLFQRDGRTVGTFLRERRLEQCRADLSDPAQARRSVCEIGRRWGFRDPAVFNRAFKSAYGVTPGAYRGSSRREVTPAESPQVSRR